MNSTLTDATSSRRNVLLLALAGLSSLSGCVGEVLTSGEKTPQVALSNYSGQATTLHVTFEKSNEIAHELTSELEEGETKSYTDVVTDDSEYEVTAEANGMTSSYEWGRGQGLLEIDVRENEIEFGVSIA